MKVKTFKTGGVHPPGNKRSAAVPIITLPPPDLVKIPLSQHLGQPAVPVVGKGDKVKVGTLIAKGQAFISANIHSSVSGIVLKIDEVLDVSGYKKEAIIIQREGDEWEPDIDRSEGPATEIALGPAEIIEKIKQMGIVGLGGAAFPTHVKYLPPPGGTTADTLIINGVECEPYLTADFRIMLERSDEILTGIRIMKIAGNVNRAVIGIETNKSDAIAQLSSKAADIPGLEVVPLAVKYPQGAEKQLINALLDREVPSGKLPLDVGCIVNNIGTALAIYEAVQKNKPLFERVVTITGSNLSKTGNFKVRIGAPAQQLFDALQIELPQDTTRIISGGPMMGKTVNSLDIPVTKGTSGFILLDEAAAARKEPQNCIRCAKCVGVCPMGLEPYLLEKLAERKKIEECEAGGAADCMECGSCSFICPSGRPLLDYIRYGKANVMRLMRERRQQ